MKLIFGVSIAALTSFSIEALQIQCRHPLKTLTRPLYIRANPNARIPIEGYKRTNSRTLSEYRRDLRFNTRNLRPGDIVIDSGSGLGLAGLRLAFEQKFVVYAINTQDFYRGWVNLLNSPSSEIDEQIRYEKLPNGRMRLKSFLALDRDKLLQMADELHLSRRSLGASYNTPSALRLEVRPLIERVMGLMRTGRFRFFSGYAEEALTKIQGKAKLILDYWGAYSYSPERLRILELYSKALSPEGRVYILTNPEKVQTRVRTSRFDKELIDFLIEKHPKIFSTRVIETGEFGFLVFKMKKEDWQSFFAPELKLSGVMSVKEDPRYPGFVPPIVIYDFNPL